MRIQKLYLILSALSATLISCSVGSSSSSGNPGIQYQALNYTGTLPAGGSTGLTGIRQVGNSSNVYITGSYSANGQNNGTLYMGPILGGGTYYVYNYPNSSGATTAGTNVYSADNGTGSNVLLVGTYTTTQTGASHNYGFLYNGPIPDNGTSWTTLAVPSSLANGEVVNNTIPHSIMGGLVVGNYEAPSTASNAFIYNINTGSYIAFSYPEAGVRYTSAYGIWYNGGTSYTIVGGFSHETTGTVSAGFIVDYNLSTNVFSNWTQYTYNNQTAAVTHFEGITSDGRSGYNLAGTGAADGVHAALVNIPRTLSGGFGHATWVSVMYPGSSSTTSDTVYQNYLLGVYQISGVSGLNGYVATVPVTW